MFRLAHGLAHGLRLAARVPPATPAPCRFLHKRPTHPNALLRREAAKARFPPTVAPSASSDAAVFAIQQAVFGYVKGSGERSGRGVLKKALTHQPTATYYPIDAMGKMRLRDLRLAAKGPEALVKRKLQGTPLVGAPGREALGPFLPRTFESLRADLRMRAARLLSLDPAQLEQTGLPTLTDERKRKLKLLRLRMRGKGPPKKGQGKRATRGAAGKKK
jgi:hypothetical protein